VSDAVGNRIVRTCGCGSGLQAAASDPLSISLRKRYQAARQRLGYAGQSCLGLCMFGRIGSGKPERNVAT
jgi:hypothetical protein